MLVILEKTGITKNGTVQTIPVLFPFIVISLVMILFPVPFFFLVMKMKVSLS